jgi:hypothetical protein
MVEKTVATWKDAKLLSKVSATVSERCSRIMGRVGYPWSSKRGNDLAKPGVTNRPTGKDDLIFSSLCYLLPSSERKMVGGRLLGFAARQEG